MRLLPKSIHWCRRYPTKFNSGRDIPMKIGVATLTPFGKEIVELEDADSTTRLVLNVIWLVLFGWEIALAHAGSALVCAISIIGIPFALQHLKLIPLALLPFGRDLR